MKASLWASLALAAILTAGASSAAFAAADPWITAKTKMALLTSEGVPLAGINVDTVDGRVTLHGKVESEAEKNRAGDVARKIDGVRDVRNLLQVVAPARRTSVSESDDQIRDAVAKALKADPTLAHSSVSVESVNQGVVLLAGTADSYASHLDAVATAARVPGVRRVATEVKSPDALSADATTRDVGAMSAAARAENAAGAAADKTKAEVRQASRSATRTMSDAWITSETKIRLLADRETPALDINVDTDGGVVTLFGTVASEAQKNAAEADARKVDGARLVKNEIQVVPAAEQKAVQAKDDEIEKAIHSQMARRGVRSGDVGVQVKDGVVRLTGSVPSESDRLTAATVARSTPGVRAVLSEDLRTKQEG